MDEQINQTKPNLLCMDKNIWTLQERRERRKDTNSKRKTCPAQTYKYLSFWRCHSSET